MTYSHRNDETVPPTKIGYYWFKGLAGGDQYADLITVMKWADNENLVAMGADTTDLSEFRGQWWGPVMPPWDES